MLYTLERLRHKVLDKAEEVYQILKDFFGEEYVDLQFNDHTIKNADWLNGISEEELPNTNITPTNIRQMKAIVDNGLSIIVWWPEVTVTNEHNRSVVIWDLYAKVNVNTSGTIPYEYHGFKLKRSTYNNLQLSSGYLHSHIPSVYSDRQSLREWQRPCLGRGPIIRTINSLKTDFSDTSWMLFCQELAMYVTVESIRGVPYRYLEDLGNYTRSIAYENFRNRPIYFGGLPLAFGSDTAQYKEWLRAFTQYYLNHNHLSIGYSDEGFIINMPFFNFIIDISNACIEYLNLTSSRDVIHRFYTSGLLVKAHVTGNTISTQQSSHSSVNTDQIDGITILEFKNEPKIFHLKDEDSGDTEVTTLLSSEVAQYILRNILKVINYRYKNEHANRVEEVSSPTYQRVIYI